MLPLKKIYIDSRDRTVDSVSSSNLKIALPYNQKKNKKEIKKLKNKIKKISGFLI